MFGGCGSTVLAAAFPALGIGFVGVSLAFGLTVLTMAFAVVHISGCHLSPAVSIGLVVGKRFPIRELLPYIGAQVLGGIAASGTLYLIASGESGFSLAGGFASNGYAAHSPGGYSLLACFLIEVVLTTFFLLVILGSTDERAPRASRRSHRPLPDADPPHQHPDHEHLGQSRSQHRSGAVCGRLGAESAWLFWVAPIAGAILGGLISDTLFRAPQPPIREQMAKAGK